METFRQKLIADNYAKQWLEANKGMLEDYHSICHDIMLFNANWGLEIGIVIYNKKDKERFTKERQDEINNSFKQYENNK